MEYLPRRSGLDYDGEPTEAQTCGFRWLNRMLGGGGQVGYRGGYALRTGLGQPEQSKPNPETSLNRYHLESVKI
jgi:hypothetical protein